MSSTNSEILANVIGIAKNKNVEADVILTQEEQLGLKADRGDLSEYKVTSSRCVGVRVVQGTQVGTSYSESVEQSSLETMVQTAIENAGYAKENPHEKICAEKVMEHDEFRRTSRQLVRNNTLGFFFTALCRYDVIVVVFKLDRHGLT